MINFLGLGLGLWSELKLRRVVIGLGLRLGLWSGRRLKVMVWEQA